MEEACSGRRTIEENHQNEETPEFLLKEKLKDKSTKKIFKEVKDEWFQDIDKLNLVFFILR